MKKDHEKRINLLQEEQDRDKLKAQLIESNLTLVSLINTETDTRYIYIGCDKL